MQNVGNATSSSSSSSTNLAIEKAKETSAILPPPGAPLDEVVPDAKTDEDATGATATAATVEPDPIQPNYEFDSLLAMGFDLEMIQVFLFLISVIFL